MFWNVPTDSLVSLCVPMQNYSRSRVAQCGFHWERLKKANALHAGFQSRRAFTNVLCGIFGTYVRAVLVLVAFRGSASFKEQWGLCQHFLLWRDVPRCGMDHVTRPKPLFRHNRCFPCSFPQVKEVGEVKRRAVLKRVVIAHVMYRHAQPEFHYVPPLGGILSPYSPNRWWYSLRCRSVSRREHTRGRLWGRIYPRSIGFPPRTE